MWSPSIGRPHPTAGSRRVRNWTKQVVVTLAHVSPSSIVLATLQSVVPNVLVAGVVVGSGKVTIVLSKATPSPVKVGWFVIG